MQELRQIIEREVCMLRYDQICCRDARHPRHDDVWCMNKKHPKILNAGGYYVRIPNPRGQSQSMWDPLAEISAYGAFDGAVIWALEVLIIYTILELI